MIKDQISPGLKEAFAENIKKTIESGREHGFYMCADKEGQLTASRIRCRGSSCDIIIDRLPETCPDKIQGLFHTHPQRSLLEKMFNRKFSEEDIKSLVEQGKKVRGLTAQTEGTVCTAGDMEPDKVGCWTPKKGAANFITCRYTKIDSKHTKEFGIEPKRWIKPLFDKEVIDLK